MFVKRMALAGVAIVTALVFPFNPCKGPSELWVMQYVEYDCTADCEPFNPRTGPPFVCTAT